MKQNLKNILLIILILTLPIHLFSLEFSEKIISDKIKTKTLVRPAYSIESSKSIDRGLIDGYTISDITTKVIEDNENQNKYLIEISNKTPRHFKSINLYIDGFGITITEELEPFTTKQIQLLEKLTINKNSNLVFLEPNAGYNPNVRNFNDKNTNDTVFAYGLLQTGLKYMYSDANTRDQFYRYFFDIRKESRNSLLSKWYNINSYDTAKSHFVERGTSAGLASGTWLSINWPMRKFLNQKNYPYIYTVYSHEHAHTMGYSHSSGLAYGWDNTVKSNFRGYFDNNEIIPGQTIQEDADVFLHFDTKTSSLMAFSKSSNYFLTNIRIIFPKELVKSTLLKENQIKFTFNNNSADYKVLINSDILEPGMKKASKLVTYVIKDIPYGDKYLVELGKWSYNYSNDAPKRSSIFFSIPQQDAVLKSDGQYSKRGWYKSGTNKIEVKAKNTRDGKMYRVDLLANSSGGRLMQSGAVVGNGALLVRLDPEGNKDIPSGFYEGNFTVTAHGWHAPYTKTLTIKLNEKISHNIEANFKIDKSDTSKIIETKTYNRRGADFTQVYFVADNKDIGPTNRRWTTRDRYSMLNVPVYDIFNNKHILKIRAVRVRHYRNQIAMNTGANFYNYTDAKLRLVYLKGDNMHLEEGRYTTNTPLTILAKGWHKSDFQEELVFNIDLEFTKEKAQGIALNISKSDTVKSVESKTYNFYSGHPDGFTQVYFNADSSSIGPINRIWSTRNKYSMLKVPVYNAYGSKYILNLRGIRVRHYNNELAMNTGQNYWIYTDSKFKLSYHKSDNEHLPSGTYKTNDSLTILAKGWHRRNFRDEIKFDIKIEK